MASGYSTTAWSVGIDGTGFEETVMVELSTFPPTVAKTFATPGVTPYTRPLGPTVAVRVDELFHVTRRPASTSPEESRAMEES
jgi:hypothetical protein